MNNFCNSARFFLWMRVYKYAWYLFVTYFLLGGQRSPLRNLIIWTRDNRRTIAIYLIKCLGQNWAIFCDIIHICSANLIVIHIMMFNDVSYIRIQNYIQLKKFICHNNELDFNYFLCMSYDQRLLKLLYYSK